MNNKKSSAHFLAITVTRLDNINAPLVVIPQSCILQGTYEEAAYNYNILWGVLNRQTIAYNIKRPFLQLKT